MSTLRAIRASVVEASRRHSRVEHETEDLAHDIILSALQRGFPLDGETFVRSTRGAARRHGAFLARCAVRRRAREVSSASALFAAGGVDARPEVGEGAPLSVLSPALRTTLHLLLLGLDKAELRAALGVGDAALRKRFQALRARGPLARPDLVLPRRTPALANLRRTQVDVVPRLAEEGVCAPRRMFAAADPDGHGVIFAEVLTRRGGTATPGASPARSRAQAKGTPCSTARSRTSQSCSS